MPPHPLINVMARNMKAFPTLLESAEGQECRSVEQAQIQVSSWHRALTQNLCTSLPALFEESQVALGQENHEGCSAVAEAFDAYSRKKMLTAKRALATVQDELEKPAPSTQMIEQALNHAKREMTDVLERIQMAVTEAQQSTGGQDSDDKIHELTSQTPLKAVEKLQTFMLSLQKSGTNMVDFLKTQDLTRTA
jgi:hypothetical protein